MLLVAWAMYLDIFSQDNAVAFVDCEITGRAGACVTVYFQSSRKQMNVTWQR